MKLALINEKEAAKLAYELMAKIPRDENSNPLTLEGVIKSVILKNPEMMQYRDDALGILYCTLGAGIGWDKYGKLGDHLPNNYMNMPPAIGGQGVWGLDFGMDDSFKKMKLSKEARKFITDSNEEIKRNAIITIQEIDERCQTYRKSGGSALFYPISWYSCNLSAPDNAQEDFFFGAIETATLICNAEFPTGTKRWLEHMRTVQYAKDILFALNSKIGKYGKKRKR